MSKLKDKILKFWYFHFSNPVIRIGESGGFRWQFRRFWLDIETLSGNFKARYMANEHPYGYLLAGKDDENIIGFCWVMYYLSTTVTTDQGLADDIKRAVDKYERRMQKKAAGEVVDDETEEKIALEEVKQVQELVDMPKKQRRNVVRDINGRFKKAVKEAEKK